MKSFSTSGGASAYKFVSRFLGTRLKSATYGKSRNKVVDFIGADGRIGICHLFEIQCGFAVGERSSTEIVLILFIAVSGRSHRGARDGSGRGDGSGCIGRTGTSKSSSLCRRIMDRGARRPSLGLFGVDTAMAVS